MNEPKYIVVEIQTSSEGTIATLVTAYNTLNEAANKYHTVLAAAAISNLPLHSAVMLDNYGGIIKTEYYENKEVDN